MSMNLNGKIALITGSSSGIGLETARVFSKHGGRLILLARRTDRLSEIKNELQKSSDSEVLTLACDVTNNDQVSQALSSLSKEWSDIEILVNNAGLARGLHPLHEAKIQDWEEMIDTNIKGLLYVTRAIVGQMVSRGSGHIVNIGSIAGHQVYPKGGVYCATKHAVRALSEGLKLDLLGTPIRVTSIDPGLVETEFSSVRFRGDTDRAAQTYKGLKALEPGDVADAILYSVTRPAHVNISEILMLPIDQASTTHVNRKY